MNAVMRDASFNIKSMEFILNLDERDNLNDDKHRYNRGHVVPYSTNRTKKFVTLSDCK